MELQSLLDTLNIHVSSQEIPDVPNTGIFSNINTTEGIFIAAALFCLVAAALILLFRKRLFRSSTRNLTLSVVLFLIATTLTSAAIISITSAADDTTDLYAITSPASPVLATATKTITLDADYPNGYTIFAYADAPDGFTIYNEDHSASIDITDITTDPADLTLNSYGIKIENLDSLSYGFISTDLAMPTVIAASLDSAEAGDTVDIEYYAHLDSSTPDGIYSTAFSNIEFHYDIYPGRPLPVSLHNDGSVDRIMALTCTSNVCRDIDGQKYTRPVDKPYYTPAFDVNIAVTPEGYGTIAPLYVAENIPYGTGVSINDATITIGDATFTATPNIIPDEHTYSFVEWDLGGLTTDGIISDMTFTAEFTRATNQYTINLNTDEDIIYTGTEQIYVVYNTDFYRDSDKNYKMSTTENKISVPTRTGYKFAGYYTEPNGAGTQFITPDGYLSTNADSTFFTKEKVDADQNILYAKWNSVNFFSITTMQEMTTDICAATTTPTTTATTPDTTGIHASDASYVPTRTLIDTRNDKEYTIKKLADGKCWMTSDLDLVLSSTVSLTNENTDLNTVESWKPSISTYSQIADWSTADATQNIPQSVRPTGDAGYDDSYGTYYSWAAAVASNDTSSSGISPNEPNSICPRGWRLPYSPSVTNSEFIELATKYGADYYGPGNIFIEPASFVRAGSIRGSYYKPGEAFSLWTSSPTHTGEAYIQQYDTTLGNSVNTYESRRDIGASIRCVAR